MDSENEEGWTLDQIRNLIDNEVEESLRLEYKSGRAIGKGNKQKNKIAKTVSSFANADGGTIIYGVREYDEDEKQHIPEKVEPADRDDMSKEALEQTLNSRIRPKIDGLKITPVSLDGTEVVFVIDVPKSDTAHQSHDNKYYKRRNFSSVPMEDYEVRDVMNRAKTPQISLDLLIVEEYPSSNLGEKSGEEDEFENLPLFNRELHIWFHNEGNTVAEYVNAIVELPSENIRGEEPGSVETIELSNTRRDVLDVEVIPGPGGGTKKTYGPSWFDPIQPNFSKFAESVDLDMDEDLSGEVQWVVYADDARERRDSVEMEALKVKRVRD